MPYSGADEFMAGLQGLRDEVELRLAERRRRPSRPDLVSHLLDLGIRAAQHEGVLRGEIEHRHAHLAERRGARYVCALALALPDRTGPRGGLPLILRRGTCRGRIADRERGSGGFGYDPLFEPAGEPPGGRTLGLWSAEEKNRKPKRIIKQSLTL